MIFMRVPFGCCVACWLVLHWTSNTLGEPAIEIHGVNNGFVDGVDRVMGWQFTVGASPIMVSQLGAFDYEQDGLIHSHEVGIWTTGQTLVAYGNVPAGTGATLDNFFRYVEIPNTTLQANTTYIIAATWPKTGDKLVQDQSIPAFPGYEVTGYTVDSSIILGPEGSVPFNHFTAVFAFPPLVIGTVFPGDPRRAFWGPNFNIVPEPGSLLLVAGALVSFMAHRRRRQTPARNSGAAPFAKIVLTRFLARQAIHLVRSFD